MAAAVTRGVAQDRACWWCSRSGRKIPAMVRQTSYSPRTIGCAAPLSRWNFVCRNELPEGTYKSTKDAKHGKHEKHEKHEENRRRGKTTQENRKNTENSESREKKPKGWNYIAGIRGLESDASE